MSRILILGAGTVGRATGEGFAAQGHDVSFADANDEVVRALRSIDFDVSTPDSVDWSDIDVVFLCLRSGANAGELVDANYLDAVDVVGRGVARASGHVTISIRTTLVPGTTDGVVVPRFQAAAGRRAGDRCSIAVNPEFLRGATARDDFAKPWITVIGSTDDRAADTIEALYEPFGAPVIRTTPLAAELIKMGSNCFNAVKISYFNELHEVSSRLGADSSRVSAAIAMAAEGMWNPVYGTRGGTPFGGVCLPADVDAMIRAARASGWQLPLIEAALDVNRRMADGADRPRRPA